MNKFPCSSYDTNQQYFLLTHWGQVMHIYISKLTIFGSHNGLSPSRRQAIIWTNAGILLIRNLGTNFSEILEEIHSLSFSKMHLEMSSAKWRLFGLGLNELSNENIYSESVQSAFLYYPFSISSQFDLTDVSSRFTPYFVCSIYHYLMYYHFILVYFL